MEAPQTSDELAEVRAALDQARKQIDIEVARRRQAAEEFEQLVAADRAQMRKQLHDGLGQVLTSISFLASTLQCKLTQKGVTDTVELDEIRSLINQAIAESRAIAETCNQQPRAQLIA